MAKAALIHESTPIDVIDSALWDSEALALALLPTQQRPAVVVRLVTPYAVACRINGWAPSETTANLFITAELALMKHADAVVPISESIATSIEQEYGVRRTVRWHTIPCGVAYWPFFDVSNGYDNFPDLEGLDSAALETSRLIVFVGRLERRKGIDLVLEAAPQILSADPSVRLIIAGADVEGWKEKARVMPVGKWLDRVHFLGAVPDATRDKLMANAHMLLFPSRYESFGLVPLEGFVHGVPVVASRSGAIPEVVQEGVSGLLFEPEQPQALADAVARLLADDQLHATLSAGARRRVRQLSSRRSALTSERLYRSLPPRKQPS